MKQQYQHLLARHCGAVIMGIKPAALFTIKEGEAFLKGFMREAALHHLAVEVMRYRPTHVLVLAYRTQLLQDALTHPLVKKHLPALGYPVESGLSKLLTQLKYRFEFPEFPHEIGFFLGYPPVDVVGFMYFSGKRCKHSCLWKVYGDVDKAKELCSAYQSCRQLCLRHIEQGGSLHSLPPVVSKAG